MIEYAHILSEFVSTPWAIEETKLRALESVLLLRAGGGRLSAEEIQARVGKQEAARQPRSANGVAVLPVYGVISHRMNLMSDMSGGTSIEKLTTQFREAMADSAIGSIVLDIDSPGGSVYGVQELADEIYAARGQKNVIAQVNPLAASAAYWLAAQAQSIHMTPSGSAGSIGVFSVHEDISRMLEAKGVKVTLISDGKYKVEGNQFEPLAEEARDFMQHRVRQHGDSFVGAVARGRDVTAAAVRSGYGQGRTLSAQDALAAGLIDKISTLDQTVQQALSSPRSTVIVAGALPQQAPAAQASEKPATAETTEEATMATPVVTPAAASADVNALRENKLALEDARINGIQALARHTGMTDKAAGWVREGKSIEDVSAEINDALAAQAKPIHVPAPGAQVELNDREQKQYSVLRGIRTLCSRQGAPGFDGGRSASCLEFEISDTIAKKLGKDTGGFYMPTNTRMAPGALRSEIAQQQFNAVMVGTAGQAPGTNLVQTTIMPSEFIDLLRNLMVCMALGARKLGDLQGNIQLPKRTAAGTLYWTGENPGSAVTASDQTIGNIQGTPKQAMSQSSYSRQFLIQSSMDAEQLIREDLAAIFALGLDLAGLVGTGSNNQPKGAANQTGVNVVECGANSGGINYALGVQAQRALEENNIPMIRPGVCTTPGVKAVLRQKAMLANTIALPIWDKDNTPWGYPGLSSNQLPSNLTKGTHTDADLHMLIFGDFWQLIFAEWGALEIIADPYTQAGKGNVVLTGSLLCDVLVRYAQAFTVIKDIDVTVLNA